MKKLALILVLCCCVTLASAAQEISVAAAADLSSVLPQIAAQFEKDTGRKVNLTFGSSGQFLLQIQNGAPFDLFFSADVLYPQRLEAEGLTQPDTMYKYARGKLVLYVPKQSPLDLSLGLRALLSPEAKRIAIANPQHAPYGRAAAEALRKEGLYDALRQKIVMGENVSQAAQYVQSGNADAGLIALSLAMSPVLRSAGRFVEVPASDYEALEQAAIILKGAKDKAACALFLDYMRRPEIVKLLSEYGFMLPEGKLRRP
jgi:molybdate transport system substrate-binding protein